MLYTDKIFIHYNITLTNLHGWSDQDNFVWSLSSTLAMLVFGLGMYLRPFIISASVPVFCLILQLMFIFDSDMTIDNGYTLLYVSGSTALVLVFLVILKERLLRIKRAQSTTQKIIETLRKTQAHHE